ncbi:MAG: SUMF1/EgtB/PvdO family nonheme iron enzyme [Planctomycetes bacterium]|nr:SUMF1/EgtB/PvdO family nonheme iron enzyme [Planctomycetota bacterium]
MRILTTRAARLALVGAALLATGCPQSQTSAPTPPTTPKTATPEPSGSQRAGPKPRGQLPKLPTRVVEAGEFIMGSDGSRAGGQDSERPRNRRSLGAFSIDTYEVTNEAYALFLASPDSSEHVFCHSEEPKGKDHRPIAPTPSERRWGAVTDPFEGSGRKRHPVVGVDWWDAYSFSAWVGRRLPSEDEWERAARHTDGRTYPWGEAPIREGPTYRATVYDGRRRTMTTTVGGRPDGRAVCGAHDMSGNAWEWTASSFLPYVGAPDGGEVRPDLRVLRGGGWNSSSPFLLRAAMRHARPPEYRSAALGFRTAGSAKSQQPGGSQ